MYTAILCDNLAMPVLLHPMACDDMYQSALARFSHQQGFPPPSLLHAETAVTCMCSMTHQKVCMLSSNLPKFGCKWLQPSFVPSLLWLHGDTSNPHHPVLDARSQLLCRHMPE